MVSKEIKKEIERQIAQQSIKKGLCPKCGRKLTENAWGQKRCQPCELYLG